MLAVETTPAASLNAAAGEKLSLALVWPVSRGDANSLQTVMKNAG
jgi:hypothetical protein